MSAERVVGGGVRLEAESSYVLEQCEDKYVRRKTVSFFSSYYDKVLCGLRL